MTNNFLQSKEWAEFQRSLGLAPNETARARSVPLSRTGREVLEYPECLEVEPQNREVQPLGAHAIMAKIIKHNLPFGKSYLYIPHGPEMDFNQMTGGFKNPVANFVSWLHDEAKKRKSIFVKAEPLTDNVAQALVEAGFRKSKKEIQPSKTVIVDLTKSEDELLGMMHHKTRYNISVADRHNVVVECTTFDDVHDAKQHDIRCRAVEDFLKLLKKTAKRDRFNTHPADYYKKLFNFPGLSTKLYFAKHNNRSVAAALVLTYGDTAYYLHGASDYKYRSLMAPFALHWFIITSNKKLGTRNYDLWGIDARKWPGVTRFKLGWGGKTLEYPGSFDLPISRFWYLVYRIARKIF